MSVFCVHLTLAWLGPVNLWGIRRADHDAENTPQPQTTPISGTHRGQAEINTGGLSQEGLSWLRESERAWVRSQMIYGDLSRASAKQSEAIYLLGWRRDQEREARDEAKCVT